MQKCKKNLKVQKSKMKKCQIAKMQIARNKNMQKL
jgi:hypothetical protein